MSTLTEGAYQSKRIALEGALRRSQLAYDDAALAGAENLPELRSQIEAAAQRIADLDASRRAAVRAEQRDAIAAASASREAKLASSIDDGAEAEMAVVGLHAALVAAGEHFAKLRAVGQRQASTVRTLLTPHQAQSYQFPELITDTELQREFRLVGLCARMPYHETQDLEELVRIRCAGAVQRASEAVERELVTQVVDDE